MMTFFNNLGLFLSNLRMVERGCGLHRLKDKDDIGESTLSVFSFLLQPAGEVLC